MEIQKLRWWHWCLISLGVGWLLAFVNGDRIDSSGMRSQDESRFEEAILTSPMGENHLPFCKDLIVYPAVSAQGPGGHPVQVMPVTYKALTPVGEAGGFEYQSYWFCGHIPYLPTVVRPVISPHFDWPEGDGGHLPPGIERAYVPAETDTLESIARTVYGSATGQNEEAITMANRAFEFSLSVKDLWASGRLRPDRAIMIPRDPSSGGMTVRQWIDEAKADYPWVGYRFAWWKVPFYERLLWVGSSFLLIGVIWPIVLRFLQGAGLGGVHLEADDYDLSRFAKGRTKAKVSVAAGSDRRSEAAAGQLAALTDAMAASLREVAGSAGAAPGAEKQSAPAPWIAPAPLTAQVLPKASEEEKEFSGEFYPVAHPVEHGKEEKSEKGAAKPLSDGR